MHQKVSGDGDDDDEVEVGHAFVVCLLCLLCDDTSRILTCVYVAVGASIPIASPVWREIRNPVSTRSSDRSFTGLGTKTTKRDFLPTLPGIHACYFGSLRPVMEGVSDRQGMGDLECSADMTGRGRGLVVGNREITFLSDFQYKLCHWHCIINCCY